MGNPCSYESNLTDYARSIGLWCKCFSLNFSCVSWESLGLWWNLREKIRREKDEWSFGGEDKGW